MMTLVLMGVWPGGALAQDEHAHATAAQPQQLTSAQSALLKIVRDNTERFKDESVAEREGYALLFGCVSGPNAGAIVIASDWDKAHPGQGAPQLMGQLFHYFESPNRFGLPAFYTLHVWAWKENPNGPS